MNHRFALAVLFSVLPAYSLSADEDRAAEPKTAAEVYGQGVRETEARTPDGEKAGFTFRAVLWRRRSIRIR